MIIGVAIWSADVRDSKEVRDKERLGVEKKLGPITGPNRISVD
jgi:hypothetical protein